MIPIKIEGPFTLAGDNNLFTSFDIDFSGVYIWAVKNDESNSFFPYYVGMSKKGIISRTRDHLAKYMSGSYWLYDIENLKKGNRNVKFKPSNPEFAFSMGYEFHSIMQSQLEETYIFCLRFENCDSEFLMRIESGIIREFQKNKTYRKIIENDKISINYPENERKNIEVVSDNAFGLKSINV